MDEFEQKQRRIALHNLSTRLNPYQKQKVLEAILLFGKAFVFSNMFFDYKPLVEEGLVEVRQPIDYDPFSAFEVNRARLIRPVFEANEYMVHPGGSDWVRKFDTYCELVPELRSVHWGRRIPEDRKALFESRLGVSFPECVSQAYIFLLGVQDIENYLSVSMANSAPLLLTYASSMSKARIAKENLREAQQVLATYAIFLNAINCVPILDSFNDLRRLLKHSALQDFRYAIWHWSDAIQQGKVANEAIFRKYIAESVAALEKATKVKRISRYLTYMSLPVAIASLFTQMPLGLVLVPVSTGLVITAHLLERKHRWVTFGR